MFTKNANEEIGRVILIHWMLMSVFAGTLNAIAFIGLGTFATHVTGFGTLFGVHVSEKHWGNAVAALAVPLFFLLGSIISGLCVEARVRRKKKPHYDYVMYVCAFLLITASLTWKFNALDKAPSYLHLKSNFVLLSIICLVSGLVNAALSYSSKATVRVTHLTGITTDLGRGIAELISEKFHGTALAKIDVRMMKLRALTIVSFSLGSVLGAFLFRWVAFSALIAPALYFIYAGIHGGRKAQKISQSA